MCWQREAVLRARRDRCVHGLTVALAALQFVAITTWSAFLFANSKLNCRLLSADCPRGAVIAAGVLFALFVLSFALVAWLLWRRVRCDLVAVDCSQQLSCRYCRCRCDCCESVANC